MGINSLNNNNNELFYAAVNGIKNKHFESESSKYRVADD